MTGQCRPLYSREKWKLVSGVVISCSGNLSAIQPASGYIALSNSSFRPSPRLISHPRFASRITLFSFDPLPLPLPCDELPHNLSALFGVVSSILCRRFGPDYRSSLPLLHHGDAYSRKKLIPYAPFPYGGDNE